MPSFLDLLNLGVKPRQSVDTSPPVLKQRAKGERKLAVKPGLMDYLGAAENAYDATRPVSFNPIVQQTKVEAIPNAARGIWNAGRGLYDYYSTHTAKEADADLSAKLAVIKQHIAEQPWQKTAASLASMIPGSGAVEGVLESAQRRAEGDPVGAARLAAMVPLIGAMDFIPGGEEGRLAVKGAEAATEGMARDVPGIIAYHGSPHSFDRFDISKIGTGEGAQAYGHGLYFAEAEPVAAEYRQRLAPVTAAPFDRIGIPPREWNAATMFARQMDPTQPEVAARDFAQWVGRDVTPELVDAFRVAREPGSMYQVRLNVRPEDLLDWDRPISTQSDIVQRFAREADIGHLKPGSKSRVMMDWFKEGTEQPHNLVKGRDLMMAIDPSLGNNFTPEVSGQLSQFGIPGIRYLDEKSRPLGEGTRNYVMFDDKLIDLLRKYAKGGNVTARLPVLQHTMLNMQ